MEIFFPHRRELHFWNTSAHVLRLFWACGVCLITGSLFEAWMKEPGRKWQWIWARMVLRSWPLMKKWWTASRIQTGELSLMIRNRITALHSPDIQIFFWCVFRVLFTYEGNSNDIRLAEKGGKIWSNVYFIHLSLTMFSLLLIYSYLYSLMYCHVDVVIIITLMILIWTTTFNCHIQSRISTDRTSIMIITVSSAL